MWNMDLILSKLYFQGLWLRVSFEINVSSSTLLYRKLDRLKYFESRKSIFNIESLKTNTHATVFCLLGECFQIFPTIFLIFLLVFVILVGIIIFDVHVPVPHVDTRDCFDHRRDSLKMYCRCGQRKKKKITRIGFISEFANWAYSWHTYDEK